MHVAINPFTTSKTCLLAPRPHPDPYELELLEGEAAEERLMAEVILRHLS